MFSFWYFEEAFMLILENFVINKKRKNSVIFKKRKKNLSNWYEFCTLWLGCKQSLTIFFWWKKNASFIRWRSATILKIRTVWTQMKRHTFLRTQLREAARRAFSTLCVSPEYWRTPLLLPSFLTQNMSRCNASGAWCPWKSLRSCSSRFGWDKPQCSEIPTVLVRNFLSDFHRSVLNYGAFFVLPLCWKAFCRLPTSLSIVFKNRYFLAFLNEITLENAQNYYFCKKFKTVKKSYIFTFCNLIQ